MENSSSSGGDEKSPVGVLLMAIFDTFHKQYGPQRWWPSTTGSPWEIMVGAVLTQRTTWTNVELSLSNMIAVWGASSLAEPGVVLEASEAELAAVLRPTGFFASKPRTLKGLAQYVESKGGLQSFLDSMESTEQIRNELLGLWGIGPETADAILLYALGRATFIADAYALRLASRWGLIRPTARYEEIRALFMGNLPHESALFNEYHALIVTHAKDTCLSQPKCEICTLNRPIKTGSGEGTVAEWHCPKLNVGMR